MLTVLMAHAVVVQVVIYIARPMTSYRGLELGIPVVWLGALSASFALVPLVVAVPSGRATDRFGERPVMLAGALLVVAATAVFVAFGDSVAGLVVGSVVLGTGQLLSVVGEQSMLANGAEPGQHDAIFGRYTFAASVGQIVGPGVIVAVGGTGTIPDADAGFASAFLVSILLMAITLAVRSPAGNTAFREDAAEGGFARALQIPGLARALFASAVILSAVDILTVYLPALGLERGLAAGFVGVLLIVRAATSMVARLALASLARLLGRRRLFALSAAVAAIAVFATAIPQPNGTLLVAVAVCGFSLGIGQPLTMSWLAEAAPRGIRGTAMALRLTGNRLGQVIVPAVIGIVAAGAGAPGVLGVTGVILVAASVAVRGVDVDSPDLDDAAAAADPGL